MDSSVFVPFTIKALDIHAVKELIRANLNSPLKIPSVYLYSFCFPESPFVYIDSLEKV